MKAPMHRELAQEFVDAVVRCLRATVGVEAVVAAIGDTLGGIAPKIAVALDVSGDVQGPVTWVIPPPIALELVRRLLMDPDPPADSAEDGASELANILTGHASEVLEAHGFRCALGVPRLHVGALPPGVKVRMTTASGPIDLVFSLSAASA